ncbi:MAG: hypothetical protein ABI237_12330 [Ginsengibacter sp.]
MKKTLIVLTLFLISYSGFSQINNPNNKTTAYSSAPEIPNFTLYKAPDSTTFLKKDLSSHKPTIIMVFSPDCGHCQHETTVLTQNISHFKNAQILMTTWLPYQEMIAFYKRFKIANYPEITMAWDNKFFFVPYYHVQTYPTLIVYNKKGKFVNSFSGNINMESVWKALED